MIILYQKRNATVYRGPTPHYYVCFSYRVFPDLEDYEEEMTAGESLSYWIVPGTLSF